MGFVRHLCSFYVSILVYLSNYDSCKVWYVYWVDMIGSDMSSPQGESKSQWCLECRADEEIESG